MRVASAATIMASACVIWVFLKHADIRNKNFNRIVFYMAICQVGDATGTAIGLVENGSPACWIQGTLTNWFPYSKLFWNAVASYMIYSVIHNSAPVDLFSLRMNIFCWGFPVILTFIPLTQVTFGAENEGHRGWCFLKSRRNSPPGALLFWISFSYFWFYACLLVYVYFIGLSVRRVSGMTKSVGNAQTLHHMRDYLMKLIWYPIISAVVWLPEAGFDLHAAIDTNAPNDRIDGSMAWVYAGHLLPILDGCLVSVVYFLTNPNATAHLISDVFGIKRFEGDVSDGIGSSVVVNALPTQSPMFSAPNNASTKEQAAAADDAL
jgi:hypothetical protein